MGDLFTKTPEVPQNAALMVAISGYNSSAYNLTLSYGGQAVYGDISDKDLDGLPAWYEELHGLSDSLLTDADLDGKFIELAAPVIGDAKARALLQQLWQLEQAAQLP
jgi:hypothetical protein